MSTHERNGSKQDGRARVNSLHGPVRVRRLGARRQAASNAVLASLALVLSSYGAGDRRTWSRLKRAVQPGAVSDFLRACFAH